MTGEKQLTPQQKFEEKLQDRIRNDIGELVPDEVLSELIQRSINRIFFEERPIKREHGYNASTEYLPAKFEQFVEDAMAPMLRDAAEDWIADNADKVREMIDSVLLSNADRLVLETMQRIMSQPVNLMFDQYNQRLLELEQRSHL
jgi:hypothetical protein